LNIEKVTSMSYIFYSCKSLTSLPYISKWNANNVINYDFIFSECSSLTSYPDISKWNKK
jgi:surface protein